MVAEITSKIGISYDCTQVMIIDNLRIRQLSAKWASRLFIANDRRQRHEVYQCLLTWYQVDGKAILRRIITSDETWVHHYTLESTLASMEWRKKDNLHLSMPNVDYQQETFWSMYFIISKKFCSSIFFTNVEWCEHHGTTANFWTKQNWHIVDWNTVFRYKMSCFMTTLSLIELF